MHTYRYNIISYTYCTVNLRQAAVQIQNEQNLVETRKFIGTTKSTTSLGRWSCDVSMRRTSRTELVHRVRQTLLNTGGKGPAAMFALCSRQVGAWPTIGTAKKNCSSWTKKESPWTKQSVLSSRLNSLAARTCSAATPHEIRALLQHWAWWVAGRFQGFASTPFFAAPALQCVERASPALPLIGGWSFLIGCPEILFLNTIHGSCSSWIWYRVVQTIVDKSTKF